MHDHDPDLFATTMAAPPSDPLWTTGGLTPKSPVLPISSPLTAPGSSEPTGLVLLWGGWPFEVVLILIL